jgi:hypothetical protein
MRKRVLACVVFVGAIGCKPKVLTVFEDFEREACACKHRDVACAKTTSDKYDAPDGLIEAQRRHWYERDVDPDVLERYAVAAHRCLHAVTSCSPSDPCDASQQCVVIDASSGIGKCAPVVGEGRACGGEDWIACAAGLHCQTDPFDEPKCDPGPCLTPPTGKCEKNAPPPAASASVE